MTLSLLTGLLITIFTMNAPAALKPGDVATDFKLKMLMGRWFPYQILKM